MKTKEELQSIHDSLMADYVELCKYMNTAEYFALDANSQTVYANQRFGMEQYLNALNMRLYVDVADLPQGSIVPSAGMFAAMSLMQTPPPQPKPTQRDRPLAGGFGSDNGMASLMVSQ